MNTVNAINALNPQYNDGVTANNLDQYDTSSKVTIRSVNNITTKSTKMTTTNTSSSNSKVNGHEGSSAALETISTSETIESLNDNLNEKLITSNASDYTLINDELKILGHLNYIEKINEKRHVFLGKTINEESTATEVAKIEKNTISNSNSSSSSNNITKSANTGETTNKIVEQINGIQRLKNNGKIYSREKYQQPQQLIHTIPEEGQQQTEIVPTILNIKYATLPTHSVTAAPLKSLAMPPPKPPMLSRTRSIGTGDNRSAYTNLIMPPQTQFSNDTIIATNSNNNNQNNKKSDNIANNVKMAATINNIAVAELGKITINDNADCSQIDEQLQSTSATAAALQQAPVSVKHYESLIEELRCPGCANAMKAPILLCKKGHSICEQCTRILMMCPLCKETFTTMRSLTVEALCSKAHFRCSHAAGGCVVCLPIALLDRHEKQCLYKPMKCFMGRVWGNCQWTGREIQWKEHLENTHADKLFQTNSANFTWNMAVQQKPLTGYYAFQIYDEMFNFYEIYDRERVLFTMTCTSSYKERKHNFAYEVQMIQPNNEALAITQKFPVHSEYDKDILMEGTCVSISLADLAKFIDEDKLLHYSVTVLVVKSPRKITNPNNILNERKSYPINYQQRQYAGSNLKSVPNDSIITRKSNNSAINNNNVGNDDGNDADDDDAPSTSQQKSIVGNEEKNIENIAVELDTNDERNWGTPQLHFNRKYLKNTTNDIVTNAENQYNDMPTSAKDVQMPLDDKLSLCSTNTSYTKKVSNTLRKSFRALKTDIIELKSFAKKSAGKQNAK